MDRMLLSPGDAGADRAALRREWIASTRAAAIATERGVATATAAVPAEQLTGPNSDPFMVATVGSRYLKKAAADFNEALARIPTLSGTPAVLANDARAAVLNLHRLASASPPTDEDGGAKFDGVSRAQLVDASIGIQREWPQARTHLQNLESLLQSWEKPPTNI